MKISTMARILLGGAIILSCAVVPLWVTRASSSVRPETNLFVLPPDMSGPYEASSPAAVWLYQQQFGSLLQARRNGFHSAQIRLVSLPVEKGRNPIILHVDRRRSLPDRSPATPLALLAYLHQMVRKGDLKHLVLPAGDAGRKAILDENHLLLEVESPGQPGKIGTLLGEALRGVVRVLQADQCFRVNRSAGDPVLEENIRETIDSLRGSGPYQVLALENQVSFDSRWIGVTSDRSREVLHALAIPLAGRNREMTFLSTAGFRSLSSDAIPDLGKALEKGAVSAGLLWDVPEGVASAELPVTAFLGVVFNMESRAAARLLRYLHWAKKTGGNLDFSAGENAVRILCRRGEGISRDRALRLAGKWEKDGLRTSVEPVADPVFRTRLAKRDFDAVVGVFPTSLESNPGYWWRSSSPGNISGYRNAKMDALISQLDRPGTQGEQEQIIGEVRGMLRNGGPWMMLEEVTLKLCGSRPALRRLGFPATR